MHRYSFNLPLFFFFLIVFQLGFGQTTIYVNSANGDNVTGDGSIDSPYRTFSKGYLEANSNFSLKDTIHLSGTFTWKDESVTNDDETTYEYSGFTISKHIVIKGQGPGLTIIQANSNIRASDRRIFSITNGYSVIFKNLTLRHGAARYKSDASSSNAKYYHGGAIGSFYGSSNGVNLTLENIYVYNNKSGHDSNSIGYVSPSQDANSHTSGVWCSGSINILNSTFEKNIRLGSIAGSTALQLEFSSNDEERNIINSTFYNNYGPNGSGAIRFDRRGGNIVNSSIVSNTLGFKSYALQGSRQANIVNTIILGSSHYDVYSNGSYSSVGIKLSNSSIGSVYSEVSSNIAYTNTTSGTTISASGVITPIVSTNNYLKTPYLEIASDSNLIDGGISGVVGSSDSGGSLTVPITDQRSALRVGSYDIGSYEYGGTISPSASISISDGTTSFGLYTKTVLITLTEPSNTFELNDIGITSSGLETGTLSVFTKVSSNTYTVRYLPPQDFTGTVTFTINSGSFSDLSGNNSIESNKSFLVDSTGQEISLFSISKNNINKNDFAQLSISLTQSSTTFLQSDIILESSGASTGSLSVFTAVNSKTYSLLYTPPSNFSGTVTLTIPVNSFENTDSPAKSNTQTSTLVLNIDTIAPEISTLSHTHSDLVVRDVNTVPFSFTFTEPMAISPKITIGSLVTNASMTISPSTNSQTWTYDWNVPSGNDGIVSATVSATDLFGNYYEGTDSLSFTIDNVSPTITLTENDTDDILLVGESTLFTASVNETVSGVPTMTIETSVGTTNDILTAAGADWTYSYTAPSNYSGVVSFTVSLLDVAGNISTATKTLTVDSVTASLTLISSPNANGKYTDNDNAPANSDTISITLTFSEEVVVSSGTYPYLTLNTLPSQNAFYSGGSGTQTLTFSYMVMDGGETADLGVTNIVLPTGAFIKDLAGNPADLSLGVLNTSNDNLSDTKDIEIRAKDPSLTTLTAATNNGTTNFGATDGNTVTYNFTSDIDLLSSSVSMTFNSFPSQPTLTQSNSGNNYTLSFTVDANTPEGALQFNLFATDTHSSTLVPEENRTADYTQSAFNQILIVDRTAPVITSTALTTPENSITGPTIVANEAVFSFSLTGGSDQALFTINPTTGVLSFVNAPDFEAPADSNADNIYDLEVKVTDIVGLTATQTIAVTVTDVSDTFGVDLRATEAQTTEEGGNSVVSVALFTQPTAAVTLNFSSSDSTEGIPSLNQMVFTTDNWNIDQTLNITGQDDQDIDGNVAYNLLVSSVSSPDANYNSLTGISLGFLNVDNEIDTDGDGFFDYQDAFPTDPLEWFDTDSDAIGNNADLDDDGDGFSDVTEITCGSNSLDATDIPIDSDDDGVLDCQDEDDDNDGIMDSIDNCQFTPNIDQIDTDGDGQGDVCDSDDDNDGYLDTEDAFPLDATEWLDTDQDGTGNNADTDDDNDGQTDEHETACGSDTFDANETSADADADGLPNCVDTDDDNDGIEDTSDAFPLDPSEWTDTDADGTGNNADTDDDNDGFTDLDELACDSNPLDKFSKPADQDNDLIPDCIDSDRDGDGFDNTQDIFPDNADEWLDSDGDGLGDNFDVDDDNDGCLDTTDVFPFDSNECLDADNDGIGDNEDPDDNNDGFEDNKLFSSGVLTPGSSGLESTWKIINIERYPNARVTIYNKNAQVVFSALGYKNDWRGTYKDSGDLLPAGSYYYVVDPNNGEKALTGWLYITY